MAPGKAAKRARLLAQEQGEDEEDDRCAQTRGYEPQGMINSGAGERYKHGVEVARDELATFSILLGEIDERRQLSAIVFKPGAPCRVGRSLQARRWAFISHGDVGARASFKVFRGPICEAIKPMLPGHLERQLAH